MHIGGSNGETYSKPGSGATQSAITQPAIVVTEGDDSSRTGVGGPQGRFPVDLHDPQSTMSISGDDEQFQALCKTHNLTIARNGDRVSVNHSSTDSEPLVVYIFNRQQVGLNKSDVLSHAVAQRGFRSRVKVDYHDDHPNIPKQIKLDFVQAGFGKQEFTEICTRTYELNVGPAVKEFSTGNDVKLTRIQEVNFGDKVTLQYNYDSWSSDKAQTITHTYPGGQERVYELQDDGSYALESSSDQAPSGTIIGTISLNGVTKSLSLRSQNDASVDLVAANFPGGGEEMKLASVNSKGQHIEYAKQGEREAICMSMDSKGAYCTYNVADRFSDKPLAERLVQKLHGGEYSMFLVDDVLVSADMPIFKLGNRDVEFGNPKHGTSWGKWDL